MASKIYTKTGDLGLTSLIGGTRIAKSDLRIETYGTIDELNSFIGLVSDQLEDLEVHTDLREIQDRLFTIGSSLACDPDKETRLRIPDLKENDVQYLEKEIDRMNQVLPVMKSFILPTGHITVSTTHISRCVCRRAERCCVNMQQHNLFIDPLIIKYLNRLSDYLFVLARFVAHQVNAEEVPWKPRV